MEITQASGGPFVMSQPNSAGEKGAVSRPLPVAFEDSWGGEMEPVREQK